MPVRHAVLRVRQLMRRARLVSLDLLVRSIQCGQSDDVAGSADVAWSADALAAAVGAEELCGKDVSEDWPKQGETG